MPLNPDQLTAADLMMGHAQTHHHAGRLLKLWRDHGVYRVHVTKPATGEVESRESFNLLHFARRCFDSKKREMR